MEPNLTVQDVAKYWVESGKIYQPDHDFWQFCPLHAGDTYIDGGAFLGRNAIKAATAMEGKGRIVCIEAQPDTFELQCAILKIYGIKIVTAINKAMWSKAGPLQYRPHFYGAGHVEPSGNLRVEGKRLENILDEAHVLEAKLLSLDVECAEANVLIGAGKYLSEHRIKHLAVAGYHQTDPPRDMKSEIIKVMMDYGYRILSTVDPKRPENSIIYATVE